MFVDRPPRFMPGDAVVSDNAGGARDGGRAPDRRRATAGSRSSATVCRCSPRPSACAATTRRCAAGTLPELERTELADSAAASTRRASCSRCPDPPTALFTGQNLITIGAIRALRALGRQRKVALVGFDDVVLGDLVEPGMTVVAQDPYALGRRAGELLFDREPRAAFGRPAHAADRARIGRDPTPSDGRGGPGGPLRFRPIVTGARRPTMKDVAAMAGVSLSTVSRVVNGSPPVDPELAVKVRARDRAARLPPQPHRRHAAARERAVVHDRPDLRGRRQPVLRRHPPRGGGGRARAVGGDVRRQLGRRPGA